MTDASSILGLVWFIACWMLLAYGVVTQQWLLVVIVYVNAAMCGIGLLLAG